MSYVDGGSYEVKLSVSLQYKQACKGMAKWLVEKGHVLGMTELDIAKEIYAHAVSYYRPGNIASVFGNVVLLYCFYKGADGVYIEDGGDSAVRKLFYNSVWTLF